MTINLKIWSDNHGKDETFGTKPNESHIVKEDVIQVGNGSNLLNVLLQWFRKTLAISPKEEIRIMARNSYAPAQGIEEVRLWVAENEYVCQAVVGL